MAEPAPKRAFSPFKLLLSLSSSSSLLALILSRLRRRPHRLRLEDDEQWLGFPGSRLALLFSGLEDDEQWLGFPGPPSSRCSSGFPPPPEGCLISSSINSWSSSRRRRRNRRRPKQWVGFGFGVRFQDSEDVGMYRFDIIRKRREIQTPEIKKPGNPSNGEIEEQREARNPEMEKSRNQETLATVRRLRGGGDGDGGGGERWRREEQGEEGGGGGKGEKEFERGEGAPVERKGESGVWRNLGVNLGR
ncbi:hypothetical protein Drorol1_Dr00003026 [Drosera rotundifolia]